MFDFSVTVNRVLFCCLLERLLLTSALTSEILAREKFRKVSNLSAKLTSFLLNYHFDISQSVLKFPNQLSFEICFHLIQHQ